MKLRNMVMSEIKLPNAWAMQVNERERERQTDKQK